MSRISTHLLRTAAAVAALTLLCQCSGGHKAATGFDVNLTLTPAAAEKLKALSQTVELSGYYFGAPIEAARDKVNEAGEIELGEDLINAGAASGKVHVPGTGIDPVALQAVNGGQPSVLVSAWLNPSSGLENVLACTTFKGTVAEAQKAPVAISCDLKP